MSEYKLWYQRPAQEWTDALPLGNGRLGAMVFGGDVSERVALNDDTLWSGYPGQNDYFANIHANGIYDQVQGLFTNRQYDAAHYLIAQNWMGRVVNSYQPLGDLLIDFQHNEEVENYRRELDLSTGVCKVDYDCDGLHYSREYFVSTPHKILGVRISCSKPESLNLSFTLDSPHPVSVEKNSNSLWMKGKAPTQVIPYTLERMQSLLGPKHSKYPEVFDENDEIHEGLKRLEYSADKGTRFMAGLQYFHEIGNSRFEDGEVIVEGADSVTIYLASGTNFVDFATMPTKEFAVLQDEIQELLQPLGGFGWVTLRETAIEDHRKYFSRVDLRIDDKQAFSPVPTDKRIRRFNGEDDFGLVSLLFQYGRYLMIAGSRPGTQPLNLQGIWNEEIFPPWECNYTLNINAEMNYWPAETCNLSEMTQPFFQMMKDLSIKGKDVAEKCFNLPGWVVNHNTDLWRLATPVEGDPRHSFWPLGAGWMCEHLWEHYLFTNNFQFLKEIAYPLMEGAAQFLSAWLVKDANGYWVTPVGTSPENQFQYLDDEGNPQQASMCPGPTMDIAVTRELFENVLEAARILDCWGEFHTEIQTKLAGLPPYQIGKKGQLLEWSEDFDEPEPLHRHTSHLYGVFPGNQITPEDTEFINAVETTLDLRGDESTGWAKGWRICLWARLLDGNHANKMITSLLTIVGNNNGKTNYRGGGGVYSNLFDAHPPFQIDGNFGATAGIAEMLLQSQNDEIHLLPALPDAWKTGHVTGLRARGGFEVDIYWIEGQLDYAVIRSTQDKEMEVVHGHNRMQAKFAKGQILRIDMEKFS